MVVQWKHGLARGVGWGLAVLGMGFVISWLARHAAELDLARFSGGARGVLVGLAALHGAVTLAPALAWRELLRHLGAPVSAGWALHTYGVSQLARYVPGNVVHLAGRQVMGQADGVAAGALARSAIWEIGLFALAGSGFGLLALPLLGARLGACATAGGFAVATGTCAWGLWRGFDACVARAFCWYVLFLAASGAIFAVCMRVVTPEANLGTQGALIGGAYVVAVIAGLVIPGAPAGAGVREFVLVLLLGGLMTRRDVVVGALLGRLLTVAGDVLLFAGASAIRRPLAERGRGRCAATGL